MFDNTNLHYYPIFMNEMEQYRLKPIEIERLFKKAVRDEETGCLVWTGTLSTKWKLKGVPKKQYGMAYINGKFQKAHRVSYAYHHNDGLMPHRDEIIMHSCDRPTCIEGTHLSLGTHSQNLLDAYARNMRTSNKGKKYKKRV